jgi:cell division protein FtsN
MASQNSRGFEFKLGKVGLIIFTFGIALLVFSSFLFGVMVGKNIETYPEKIAKDIPKAIKQKIVDTSNKALSKVTKKEPSPEDTKTVEPAETKDDFKLEYYDRLTKKEESRQKPSPPEKKQPTVDKKEKAIDSGDSYCIQVASFRNKSQMERLRTRLISMGYSPTVDTTSLTSQGTWFRIRLEGFANREEAKKVVSHVEKDIRGLKCMIFRKK